MPDQPKTFYLTTPIYYVNARPHIGHAYSTIVADVLARRHRLLGDDTYFLTGTDEHGQKIERSAAAANIPPQQFADQVSAQFRTLWDRMGLTYNDYIRTTEPRHKTGVQKLFRELYHRGHIYLSTYTGAYCVSDEAFVDAPIGTPCPDCGKLLEQVTEENFFFKLSAFQEELIDLIESEAMDIEPSTARNEVLSFLRGDPRQPVLAHLPGVEQMSIKEALEKTLFALTLDAEDPTVGKLVNEGKLAHSHATWYVPGALKDLSISRSSFTWGIPVPDDILQHAGATQKHVVYVWLDALANYITALGYGSDDETLFKKFWPADVHLVGKEITRFHCVYWPAFLLAAGIDTPKQVTANGWLLFDNAKMSKSKGNVVRTETILSAFGTLCPPPLSAPATNPIILSAAQRAESKNPEGDGPATATEALSATEPTPHDRDLFAADVLRYYLLREIPFGQDGSFSFDTLITRYNADLANGYGNLVSRTLSMIDKYFGGEIPDYLNRNVDSLTAAFKSPLLIAAVQIEAGNFSRALELITAAVTSVDSDITTFAPWKLAASIDESETGEARRIQLAQRLHEWWESIRIITALLYPILPYATARVWQQLGLGDIEQAAANGELTNLQWGGLKPGTKLGPLGPIFPRADKGLAQIMIDMENPTPLTTENGQLTAPSTSPAAPPRTTTLPEPTGTLPVAGSTAHTTGPEPTPAPLASSVSDLASSISIDDFAKVELRIAEVKLCERIPKADKLLRLEVDLGPLGTRQILSGIAEHYTPEEMIGKRIIVITNLAPRKMRGLESHGMLLAASSAASPENPAGGKPYLATVPEGVPLGTRLK